MQTQRAAYTMSYSADVREAGINTVWIVDNSWRDGHERGLADVDRVRRTERDRKFDVRAWLTNQLPYFLFYNRPADAALCLTLIGCGTQDQNKHQGKWNQTVDI